MSEKPNPRSGDVQSVQRALDLLEAVSRSGEVGVSEVARQVGLPVSTAHSLVRTLARRHYLSGASGRYQLGPAVTVLLSQGDAAASLSPTIQPVLSRVADETGHAATATLLVGREARIIGFIPAPGPVTATAGTLGWTDPLRLATGRLLVAFTREPQWSSYVANSPEAEPGWSSRRWVNELRAIQRVGVAVKTTADPRSSSGIATPVWAHGGVVACSIGCSAPTFLLDDLLNDQTLDALWHATVELSAHLGCGDLPVPQPVNLFSRRTPAERNTQ